MLLITFLIVSFLIFPSHAHSLTVKGRVTCGEYPAAAVTIKLWKSSEKSIVDESHSDKDGNFKLTAETIEKDYTPIIAIYHDCDDGLKAGQRKLKFQVPKHYVGSGNEFDLGSFNLETRVKHNEERQKHVDKVRRDVLIGKATTKNVLDDYEEPDDRNDPW